MENDEPNPETVAWFRSQGWRTCPECHASMKLNVQGVFPYHPTAPMLRDICKGSKTAPEGG